MRARSVLREMPSSAAVREMFQPVCASTSTTRSRTASSRELTGPPLGVAPAGGFADALKHSADRVDAIPASPPPEVIDEMLAAQRAIDEMHARGRTLHFAMDGARVRIEVQDLDGNVLKEIPPSRALEVATGRAVE